LQFDRKCLPALAAGDFNASAMSSNNEFYDANQAASAALRDSRQST